jgi:hypothetical protein
MSDYMTKFARTDETWAALRTPATGASQTDQRDGGFAPLARRGLYARTT